MSFPNEEDYEEGNSPVRDLTLVEQINYWKARAKLAERTAHENLERMHELEEQCARDPADFWKENA
jgi:hypothetical protein